MSIYGKASSGRKTPTKDLAGNSLFRGDVESVTKPIDPTTTDINYNVPTLWINGTTDETWILTDLTSNVATWKQATGSSSANDEFIDHIDTPNAYTGAANQLVAVNSGETALEFIINLAGVSGGRTITGGTGASETLELTGSSGAGGSVVITDSTNCTDKDTGALVVANGGVGVEQDVCVGGDVDVGGGVTATTLGLTGNLTYSFERFTTTAAPIVISTSVTLTLINMDTNGATATLADGTTVGQVKIILIESEAAGSNDLTITVSTLAITGATKIKFRAIGQGANLIWTPSGWLNHPGGGNYLA